VLILALGVALAPSGRCFAARYVPMTLSINGKAVLKAGSGDNGSPGPDVVWRYLKNAKFQPTNGFSVEPDRDDPLRATLAGNVVVDVSYGGRADVSELKLVRATKEEPWQIAPEEIERTFKSRHKPFVFSVSIEGKPTLWTVQRTRTGKTADNPDNVWRELKRLTIYGKKIPPDPDDPLHATLTGGVIIKLLYAGQTWGQAEVSQLKLCRDRANTLWRIEPPEVERTFSSRTKPE
jgi:hypothetical protein